MTNSQFIDMLRKPRFSILGVGIVAIFLASLMDWKNILPASGSTVFVDSVTSAQTLPVLINELLAHTDPPQKDTVELYNPNSQAVGISNWYLTDAFDKPKKFKLPANSIIPANGYLLFTPDEFEINARFIFSAEGEEVYLFAADARDRLTGYYHGFSFGASTNGVSFGRYVTSTGAEAFPAQSRLTLGTANAEPRIGPIVFSKIAPRVGGSDGYIEFTNASTTTVALYDPNVPDNRWQLQGVGDIYAFPPNLTLAPAARLIVTSSEPEGFRKRYGITSETQIVGYSALQLPATGANLILQMPDPPNKDGVIPYVVVDVVEYANSASWQAHPADKDSFLQRIALDAYANDPANWRLEPMAHSEQDSHQ